MVEDAGIADPISEEIAEGVGIHDEVVDQQAVQELDGERQDDSFFSLGSDQISTIEEVQYIANLIKDHPGERSAKVMGKEVSVSDYAIEAMKEFLKR